MEIVGWCQPEKTNLWSNLRTGCGWLCWQNTLSTSKEPVAEGLISEKFRGEGIKHDSYSEKPTEMAWAESIESDHLLIADMLWQSPLRNMKLRLFSETSTVSTWRPSKIAYSRSFINGNAGSCWCTMISSGQDPGRGAACTEPVKDTIRWKIR